MSPKKPIATLYLPQTLYCCANRENFQLLKKPKFSKKRLNPKLTPLFLPFFPQSNIREVPDHQEIYLDASGFSSVIIELAERVTQPPTDEEALKFHFEDIVDDHDTSRIWRTDAAHLAHFSYVEPPLPPSLFPVSTFLSSGMELHPLPQHFSARDSTPGGANGEI